MKELALSGYDAPLGTLASGGGIDIPQSCFTLSNSTAQNPELLFEGASEGKGELRVVIHAGNKKVAEMRGPWIEICDVKTMYMRGLSTPTDGIPSPYTYKWRQPRTPSIGFVDDSGNHPFVQSHDEDDSTIVFVHGIHPPFSDTANSYEENIKAAEIMFKRLWHTGYKGRFAFYKWPARTPTGWFLNGTGFYFNDSEYRAWKYGAGLASFVSEIKKKKEHINIVAHSQGNIVVGAAIQEYGMVVDNYVLTQAAVPAGCYDESDPINSYTAFVLLDPLNPTPDFAHNLGYRGYLKDIKNSLPTTGRVTGRIVNFFNVDDYALSPLVWEFNQIMYKPDNARLQVSFYTYLTGVCRLVSLVAPPANRRVRSPHEAMSFVARSRSIAAGRGALRGSITHNFDLQSIKASGVNGKTYFGDAADDHSAQVNRPIHEVWNYYERLLWYFR